MRHRLLVMTATSVAVAGAGAAVVTRYPPARRAARRALQSAARRARYEAGRLDGVRYRIAGRTPDPEVEGNQLADRVRSVLGPLEHRLDLPRLHVTADGHAVRLDGVVDSSEHARVLVDCTRGVSGVGEVRSNLRVGIPAGMTRPSAGRLHEAPSRGYLMVIGAAHRAGVPSGGERLAVRSVLSVFAGTLPPDERRHFLGQLPHDLRALVSTPRPAWASHRRLRRMRDLVSAAALPPSEHEHGEEIAEAILGAVREVADAEAVDVAAVLPAELRAVWKSAPS